MSFLNSIRDSLSTTHGIKQREELKDACVKIKLASLIIGISVVALGILSMHIGGIIAAVVVGICAYDVYKISDNLHETLSDAWRELKASWSNANFQKSLTKGTLVSGFIMAWYVSGQTS